jgi:hypothetical protein
MAQQGDDSKARLIAQSLEEAGSGSNLKRNSRPWHDIWIFEYGYKGKATRTPQPKDAPPVAM